MHLAPHVEAWLRSVAEEAGAAISITDRGPIYTFADRRYVIFREWLSPGYRFFIAHKRQGTCQPPFGPHSFRGVDGIQQAAGYVSKLVEG